MRIQGKASEHTMEDNRGASLVPPQPPHVLIFPAPIQGPINSTLSMAELLCIAGFHVTVLVTEDIHSRLQTRGGNNVQSRFERYPGYFQLRTISDGLPEDHPRSYDKFMDLYESLHTKTKVYFKESLTSGSFKSNAWPPVSCIIADSLLRFTYDVAKEIGIPIIYLRTFSACCLWVFFCLPKLIEAREIPYKSKQNSSSTFRVHEE